MFWRPLMAVPPFFTSTSWSASHLLQPFHSHLSTNDDQHLATPWLATCRDSCGMPSHALRANFRILSSRESDFTFLPLWLHWDGRSPGFLCFTFKGVLAFGKIWMWEEIGLVGMAKLGERLKKKKTISNDRESRNSRKRYHHHHLHHHRHPTSNYSTHIEKSINGNSFQLLLLSAMKSWNKSLLLKQKTVRITRTKHTKIHQHTNSGNIPPIQNSSRFVATAVSWNKQRCCLCPLSVAVAVAVPMICLLKTLGSVTAIFVAGLKLGPLQWLTRNP